MKTARARVYEVTLKCGDGIVRVIMPSNSHIDAQKLAARIQDAPLSAIKGSRIIKGRKSTP